MNASIASHREPSPALRALALSAGAVACIAMVAAACVLILRCSFGAVDPRSPGGGVAIAASATILASAVAAAAWPLLRRTAAAPATESQPEPQPAVPRAALQPAPMGAGSPFVQPTATAAPPPWPGARLVQRVERFERHGPDGAVVDAAVGRVVVRFPGGSRAAVAHVGFCPPFAATPRVSVSNECDGLEVDVTAPEVLPWGVRIECRLEEPSEEPLDVEVDLVAEPADER